MKQAFDSLQALRGVSDAFEITNNMPLVVSGRKSAHPYHMVTASRVNGGKFHHEFSMISKWRSLVNPTARLCTHTKKPNHPLPPKHLKQKIRNPSPAGVSTFLRA